MKSTTQLKCPHTVCVWRAKDDGRCIAPMDERVRRYCALPVKGGTGETDGT